MLNKTLSNQSNSNIIIPSNNDIKKIGFEVANFEILPNSSKKAYAFENESKQELLDNFFNHIDVVFLPQKDPNTIRILDYNVHDWVTVYDKYGKKRDIDNFLYFFKLLDADIICLQEVVPLFEKEIPNMIKVSNVKENYNFKFLVKKMKEIGYKYCSIANNVVGEIYYKQNPKDYYVLANAIFSKNKFDQEIYLLTGNRSAMVSHFANNNFNYIVINTHIEYSKKNFNQNRLKKEFNDEDIRSIQVKELLQLAENMKSKYNTKNVFLCGDFNAPYNHKVLKPLFKNFISLKTSKATNLYGKITTDFIAPSKETMRNIFIFEYDSLDAKLSDHLPVFMDFVPNTIENKSIINKLKYKSQVIKIDKYDINYDYIDTISNNVTKYAIFDYSDFIVDQYYLNTKSWYYDDKLQPMYELEPYDYKTLVKNLIDVNDYYENYKEFADMFNGSPIRIDKKIDKYKPLIEDMLLQFIKCRKEMKVITVWPAINFEDHAREMINVLHQNGDIYYLKEIYLDYWGAMSLMFQIYATTDRNKTMSHLNYNVVQKGWNNKEEKKRIVVVFYEYKNKNKGEISGSESEFKTILRSFWKTNQMRPYDILHINDYFQETVDYASLYLNDNSLKMLEKQDIAKFLKLTSHKELVYLNTLKKTFYNNFKQDELIRFIVFSSIVLYVIGLRKFNDIDGFIYPAKKKDSSFNKLYDNLFDVTSKSFIPFVDISYNDSKAWQDYILQFLDKVAFMYNKVTYKDIVFNPNYHFYFFGIKMHLIELEIIKRIYRYKPSSWADVVMIKEKLKYPIHFPKIPKHIKYYYKNVLNKDYLIDTIVYYLRKNYGVKKTKEEIEGMISSNAITTNIEDKNINKDIKYFKNILGK